MFFPFFSFSMGSRTFSVRIILFLYLLVVFYFHRRSCDFWDQSSEWTRGLLCKKQTNKRTVINVGGFMSDQVFDYVRNLIFILPSSHVIYIYIYIHISYETQGRNAPHSNKRCISPTLCEFVDDFSCFNIFFIIGWFGYWKSTLGLYIFITITVHNS